MLSLDESLALYPRLLLPLASETIPLTEAVQRVLAAPLAAANDLPRFDQSAMDGYALRAADIAAASESKPHKLPVQGESAAAAFVSIPVLKRATAMRIFTGARVPDGADTVIPQERVQRDGDTLEFSAPYPVAKNIRYQGEELRRGEQVAESGRRITAGLLAALINSGLKEIPVHRRPRIAVLSTGDEVRPFGTTLQLGELPDSNSPLISAQLARWSYPPPPVQHLRDREAEVMQTLDAVLNQFDIVLTTGGASVGDKDFIPGAAKQLGVETLFWKVAQKPGKPIFFGRRGSALLLALPGNPASVLVGLLLHLRRILDCLEGLAKPGPELRQAKLAAEIRGDAQRAQILRMRLAVDASGQCWLHPLPKQDSHMLSNLGEANALAIVPACESASPAGTVLSWIDLSA
ncbi:MAG: molybdopterin molybdotransferase MoeA [Nevskiales bacterium]